MRQSFDFGLRAGLEMKQRDRDRPHPATFPSRLPEQCLRLHGLARIELALDPFTGLGSTAVACARLGVNFVGSDIDATYLDAAIERTKGVAGEGTRELPARGRARMKKAELRQPARRLKRS